jgi:hypothetical protein
VIRTCDVECPRRGAGLAERGRTRLWVRLARLVDHNLRRLHHGCDVIRLPGVQQSRVYPVRVRAWSEGSLPVIVLRYSVGGMRITPVTFAGGSEGEWRVRSTAAVIGESLPPVSRLAVFQGAEAPPAAWALRGVVSNERYVVATEHQLLKARSPALGRGEATYAALIPIMKSDSWWALSQDERRAILEERSHHIATGMKYLPAIARRLHHSRDLGEPFDFLTWFEFAPSDEAAFDDLVGMLRETEEWMFVDREVDVRLER